ncbi:MAG: class I SAM-dependent methyltransferase [Candidatus Aenigmarchaeota archaeon]|nr:class I SAM-dependent methyltransferase [Candidatus Aenigmarchaeota archaeon]
MNIDNAKLIKKILEEFDNNIKHIKNIHYPTHILISLIFTKEKRQPKILDAGCGRNVKMSLPLLKEGFQVFSLDYSSSVVKMAFNKIKNHENSFRIKADAHNLPFKRDSFDLILSNETIEYLSSPQKFLSEANRVMKESGYFMLSTPNRHGFQRFSIYMFGVVHRMLSSIGVIPKRRLQFYDRPNMFTWNELRKDVNSNDFKMKYYIGEIGILRILDPILIQIGLPSLSVGTNRLLLILDLQIGKLLSKKMVSGWSVILIK